MLLANHGLLSRLFRPMFGLISKSWHMFPLGFLFGLGFGTATEIGLLSISAAEASKGLPIRSILVFPVLFTAGMSLVDSIDSLLMFGAYGWAFVLVRFTQQQLWSGRFLHHWAICSKLAAIGDDLPLEAFR